MKESAKIIQQAIDSIPSGPLLAKVPKIIKVPAGESYVQTENPLGPALNNPGATDLKPYIVTTVGIGVMMFFALVATAMALDLPFSAIEMDSIVTLPISERGLLLIRQRREELGVERD